MKPLRALLLAAFLLSPLLGITACSDEATCESLCQEAQEGNCTSIKGDCAAFCASLNNVKDPAGCAGQYDSYQDCLSEGSDACDVSCSAQETGLSLCVGVYCAANAGNADCQTLLASF